MVVQYIDVSPVTMDQSDYMLLDVLYEWRAAYHKIYHLKTSPATFTKLHSEQCFITPHIDRNSSVFYGVVMGILLPFLALCVRE